MPPSMQGSVLHTGHARPLADARMPSAASNSLQHGRVLQPLRQPQRCFRQRRPQSTRAQVASTGKLPPKLKQIVGAFQMVPDEMARYKQLLFLASKLPPLPKEYQTDANKVQGCVSQVWVVGELQNGKLKWQADSDSQLTKGLAALLVQGLGDCAPEEVLGVDPAGIIDALGLKQKLTPSRNNGFLNMFRLMQRKSHELMGGSLADLPAAASGAAPVADAAPAAALVTTAPAADSAPAGSSGGSSAAVAAEAAEEAAAETASATPVQDSMRRKLEGALRPDSLEIVDESSQHAGHVGSRMKAGYSGETHFNVKVVSDAFEGQNTVKRHRTVYGLLDEELKGTVHALSLTTRTREEEVIALARGDV